MENFPSNSYSTPAPKKQESVERKKVQKVVSTPARTRKKPLGKKLAETFTADDTSSVGHYILTDVLIPAAKNMISDAVSQGIERLLFGDRARPNSGPRNRGNYTAYHTSPIRSASTMASAAPRRDISHKARSTHEFGEIILVDRGEAEEVLDGLTTMIKEYDHATVADLYDLVDITGSFTDSKWGWFSMAGSGVRRIREGYILDLPPTEPID